MLRDNGGLDYYMPGRRRFSEEKLISKSAEREGDTEIDSWMYSFLPVTMLYLSSSLELHRRLFTTTTHPRARARGYTSIYPPSTTIPCPRQNAPSRDFLMRILTIDLHFRRPVTLLLLCSARGRRAVGGRRPLNPNIYRLPSGVEENNTLIEFEMPKAIGARVPSRLVCFLARPCLGQCWREKERSPENIGPLVLLDARWWVIWFDDVARYASVICTVVK